MKLYEKMREQKLLSTTLLLLTLSVGIFIGTLINTGVHAARPQNAAPDATPLVIPQAAEVGSDFTKIAKKVDPSVVNITAEVAAKETARGRGKQEEEQEGDESDLLRRFFKGGPEEAPQIQRHTQSGTGFIVDKNGYILTNYHVVEGVDRITVKTHDDTTEYRAQLIGADGETDIAVLKIDPKHPLTPVAMPHHPNQINKCPKGPCQTQHGGRRGF